ncbi:hypothetical protein [Chryseobacterium rhizosphaerae]|uniref:hypothetical protein n=1 Tax=Chryseobacterium rhizosphaerae TaxID=395937 RepID=UPI002359F64F|nr:hypothetical protein [Chryseobacterium rhizosphaerae]MDC8101658.1 hypothetical protein [Chryseobacterium rhizosphaerae]
MRTFLILMALCLISCENKVYKKDCKIDFKIQKNTINYDGIVTDLKLNKNILTVSISNLRSDTLCFAAPHLIFAKEEVQQDTEKSDIVVKQFIPNIVTDKVIAYSITETNKKQIISIDSSKTRDMEQYEFKLVSKGKFVVDYLLNCNDSDSEKYKIYFFESNRFINNKYKKVKYPENGTIEIKHN